MKKIGKILTLGLVIFVSLVLASTSVTASCYDIQDVHEIPSIVGHITGFSYNAETGGSITITNIYGQSVTMIINPYSLSPLTIGWILAAMEYEWIVQASYVTGPNGPILKNLEIYPVFSPVTMVFKVDCKYYDVDPFPQ